MSLDEEMYPPHLQFVRCSECQELKLWFEHLGVCPDCIRKRHPNFGPIPHITQLPRIGTTLFRLWMQWALPLAMFDVARWSDDEKCTLLQDAAADIGAYGESFAQALFIPGTARRKKEKGKAAQIADAVVYAYACAISLSGGTMDDAIAMTNAWDPRDDRSEPHDRHIKTICPEYKQDPTLHMRRYFWKI